jgi:hypothetical protein
MAGGTKVDPVETSEKADQTEQAAKAVKINGRVVFGLTADDISESKLKGLKRAGIVECQTCASRTYQDGSNESDVSFQTPGHISPDASAGTVAAHEGQHVANAKAEANKPGVKLVSANVRLETAICPECGRSYVSGGTTTTQMKYSNPENPYSQNTRSADAAILPGANLERVSPGNDVGYKNSEISE